MICMMAGAKWDQVRAQQRIAANGAEPAWRSAVATTRERPDPISPDELARRRRTREQARADRDAEVQARAQRRSEEQQARRRLLAEQAAKQKREAGRQRAASRQRPAAARSIVGMRARRDFPSCLVGLTFWDKRTRALLLVLEADLDTVKVRQDERERRVRMATFVARVD